MKKLTMLATGLLACAFAHAEGAVTLRAADLLSQPQSDAERAASLAENTRVDLLRRSGAWSEVKTAAGQSGWLRMMNLRLETAGAPAAASRPAAAPLAAITGLLTSGRTSSSGTVTTGVRGLSQEDLQNARANPAEMKKAESFAASKAAAQNFARDGGLTANKVDYLPDAGSAKGAN